MTTPAAASSPVTLRRDGHVARVQLNRPAARNAFDDALTAELAAIVEALGADPGVRCILVTGAGRAFAAGADLKAVQRRGREDNLAWNDRLRAVFDAVEALRCPVVAAINGPALGGGLELALACTLRVAADHAVLGLPEVTLGLLPGAGGTSRLPRVVGRGAALRMLLTGEPVAAAEALRIGLVDVVVPAERLLPEAEALAGTIARNAPLAVAAVKDLVLRASRLAPADEEAATARHLRRLTSSADLREGVAAFLDRRPPHFSGT